MGDGNVGIGESIKTYVAKCPGKAVSLEVIVQGNWRLFNYRDPRHGRCSRSVPAAGFARFLTLAEKGVPKELPPPAQGRRAGPAARWRQCGGGGRGAPNPEAQARNLADVEASVGGPRSHRGGVRRPRAEG